MNSQPYRVLIVAVNLPERRALRGFLERETCARYICLEAASLPDALACCRSTRPDAVAIDNELPGGAGPALLAALADAHQADAIATLLLLPAGDRQIASNPPAGAHESLAKGPSLEYQLGRAVLGAIGLARLQRELGQARERLQQAQAGADEQRQLLHAALASIGEGVICTDAQSHVTLLNAEAERLTGWRGGEACGQPLAAVLHCADAGTRAPIDPARALPGSCLLLARDGHATPISIRAAALARAGVVAASTVLTFRDVSQQHETETLLGEERARFASIAGTMPGIVHSFRLGPDGAISFPYASSRIAAIYGLPPAALARDATPALNLWHPDDRAHLLASMEDSRKELQPWHAEFRVLHPTDGERWLESHAIPQREADGATVWYGVLTDITARKQTGRALLRAVERLRVLADASRAFAESTSDTQSLLSQIAHTAAEQLQALCIVRLLSDDGQHLELASIDHADPVFLEAVRNSLMMATIHVGDASPPAMAVRTGKPIFIAAIGDDETAGRFRADLSAFGKRFHIHTMLVALLSAHGRVFGTLAFLRAGNELPAFDTEDLALAQDLAERAALALANARLLEQVQAELAERTRAEAEARERERKLSTLLDLLPVGISILDAQRVILYANPAIRRIIGLSDSMLQHGSMPSNTYINADGGLLLPEHYASVRAYREHQPIYNVETGVVKEDGSLIWTNVNAVPVDFPDWKVVVVSSNITVRKHAERAVQRSNQRLNILAGASHTFAAAGPNYQEVLERVAQTVAGVLGDSCAIYVLGPDRTTFELGAIYDAGPDKRALERAIQATMSLRVEERSIGEHIIQKRQALVLPVADEEKVCPAGEAKRGLLAQGVDVHSLLAAPLLLQGQVTGMLCLYRHNADLPPFDTDDAVLAQDLADRATLAISSARLFQQAQRAANRLHHLRAIDQAILTERPLVAIARAAATHIGHLAPTIRVGVLLVDLATQTSTILALLDGGVLQTPPPAPLPLMVFGVALETLLLGHTYLVGDVAALPEIPILLQMNVVSQVRSFLQVPIMADGQLVGLLNMGGDATEAFTSEHIEIAREVAAQLSVALQQVRLRGQIERHAHHLEQRVAIRTAELQTALKRAEALYAITNDTIASDDLLVSLERALERACTALHADRMQVVIFNWRDASIQYRLNAGPGKDSIDPSVSFEEYMRGLSGWVIREQQSAISPTGVPDPRESPDVRQRRSATASGAIGVVPLLYLDEIFGTLTAINRPDGRDFTAEDIALMIAIAGHISLAYARARLTARLQQANAALTREVAERTALSQQVQKQAERADARAALSQVLAEAGHDLQPLFGTIAKWIGDEIGDACMLSLVPHAGDTLDVVAYYHHNPAHQALLHEIMAKRPCRLGEGIAGGVAQTGRPVLVAQMSAGAISTQILPGYNRFAGRLRVASVVGVAVRARGQILGSLIVHREQAGNPYTESDQALLQDLADRAGLAIENARLISIAKHARADAERANQAKTAFLAAISHELRTPLNAIIGFTGTLIMKLPGPLNTEQERQLLTVQRNAQHQLTLINDLLDLSRIESGKMEVRPETIACQDLLKEISDSLRPLAAEKGILFTIVAPAAPLLVQSDRRLLRQILINLIGNAIKFTDAGEVAVAVWPGQPSAGAVCFTVRDTGIGIAPEEQMLLFSDFGRVNSAAVRVRQGTGLGLSLSQKMAALLGGTIELQSEAGSGSTFTLVLGAA